MCKIIDGNALADQIKDKIVKEVVKLPSRPNLAILLVGERPDSALYVARKEKEAKKCGIDTHLYKFGEDASEQELLDCIDYLNKDDLIDGILLQMPLPKHLDANKIAAAVSAAKEVDGFHPENLKKIRAGKTYQIPVLAAVILEILNSINCDLRSKTVALLAHSDIFMNGVGEILQQRGATILPCSYDKHSANELQSCSQQADIVITAVGKKHYLTAAYIKPEAIVIDIGIIREGDPSDKHGAGKTFGDVESKSVGKIASFLTPVPGGVGPMTIACALRNVVELYKVHKVKIRHNHYS
ncbi:bifunctional methylenetetrahydrofolate dehydrogenase/methenyltetrahydrofolate cyclohydrolase [Candidatus Falkowbacteria bacterium CG10_big_fil_rev_8_21_14_0_10_44_15]|uniref:Bifunctional protein FolD n=1 Tax=Candidatus Falkowbacteria bacterium CG10_big_fil_rev_8_21_14_0_10_44_15 TaxID=1974569 RepID=A0A2H0V1I0_9BACT|nr:MAG: bifunctional methylenetetrahydrofolate dehydrogenase/methenyltetrahydrofolate cyclohydrolase [Candidatus Falkowbacteria bacterium CG10_big_fil_rev_8_21_14_0_10_44_15]